MLSGQMSNDPSSLAHCLVPLALACGLIYEKVYAGRPTGPSRQQALDSIARTVATVAPIYEYAEDPAERPRELTRAELAGGVFEGGAQRLCYSDSRTPLVSLAMSANDVSVVIRRLAANGY